MIDAETQQENLAVALSDDNARLRARIAELEAEVQRAIDFGHSMYAAAEKQAWNAALEASAGVLQDQIPALEAEYGPRHMMVAGMRQDVEDIRALMKKEGEDG